MNFRRWLFVLLSVVTIGANSESVLRLVQNAIFKVSSSKFDFCSTGGSVDDARHMAAMAYSSCVRVAYCIADGRSLQPLDRSLVLAMSWETAPWPIIYGAAGEVKGAKAIVAFKNAVGVETEIAPEYYLADSSGGVSLWTSTPSSISNCSTSGLDIERECEITAALLAILALGMLLGGLEGGIMSIVTVSVLSLLQVGAFHSVSPVAFVIAFVVSLLIVGLAIKVCHFKLSCELEVQSGCFGTQIKLVIVTVAVVVYAALALTHTFVAPNGLGTVGGRARLMLLSRGFPDSFFVDPIFALYQPTYPPGAALFVLCGYVLAGGCGEWLVQLVPCVLMGVLFAFMLTKARSFAMSFWLVAIFLSPLTMRLASLFYPEVYVAICVLVGWERIRNDHTDWIGWLVLGAAWWFKNEGLVYFVAIMIAISCCARDDLYSILVRAACGLAMPMTWFVGCRIAGGSLDGYLPLWQVSFSKFLTAAARLLRFSFMESWKYGFVLPTALLLPVLLRFGVSSRLMLALSFFGLSGFAFVVIFSLSSAVDFDWHLDSMERLLFVPSLVLAREVITYMDNYLGYRVGKTSIVV